MKIVEREVALVGAGCTGFKLIVLDMMHKERMLEAVTRV